MPGVTDDVIGFKNFPLNESLEKGGGSSKIFVFSSFVCFYCLAHFPGLIRTSGFFFILFSFNFRLPGAYWDEPPSRAHLPESLNK